MTIEVKRVAIGLLLSTLLFLVLVKVLSGSKQQGKPTVSFSNAREQQLAALINKLQEDLPIPAIGVALVSGDSVFYTTAGVRNKEEQPFTVTTPIFTGSLSEPLIATAILKLQEQDKLNLDDPVIDHLPYFKMGGNTYKKVTIRNLLTHTSGIPKYEMIWDSPNYSPNAPQVTTRSIASQLPKFNPGSRISRSPYNYDILADVINKITGHPFENFIEKEIFIPAAMPASTFLQPKGNEAKPFKIDNWLLYKFKQDTLYPYNRENAGSNGFHTSTSDMVKWMRLILNEGRYQEIEVLRKESQKELIRIQFSSAGNKGVALGFDVLSRGGEIVLTKSSYYGGFNSELVLLPGRKIGVAVFSNISGYLNVSSISQQLAEWLEGKPLVYPKVPISIPLGKKLIQSNDLEAVLKEYEQLSEGSAKKYDCSADALAQFGMSLLYKIRDRHKAIRVLEYCTKKFPESVPAHLYLAEAYLQNKDLTECKKVFAKAKSLAGSKGLNQEQAAYIEENILVLEEKKQG
ncbi:serine hydrolase [Desertivirga arenae]|uniref:serine hydrolase n=1 Tax=Desertivirga arenae TaxID=2810309 RepID=UPI001A95B5FC|nr:serine hydrolase [Pedobacter sp. SYSU D00823]